MSSTGTRAPQGSPSTPDSREPRERRPPAWHPRRASGRLLTSVVLGSTAAALVPGHIQWALRGVVGWDVFALTLLFLAWRIIVRASPEQTKTRASAEDPGRNMVLFIALGSSLFSLFAALVVIRTAKQDAHPLLWGILGTAAVVLSWLITHTSYSLRYSRLYYRNKTAGGLEFPGGRPPCEMDFAYFAFVIGMCFQVSDVTISSSRIRRAVLGHSLLSFVYNTVIVATVLNLVLGFLN